MKHTKRTYNLKHIQRELFANLTTLATAEENVVFDLNRVVKSDVLPNTPKGRKQYQDLKTSSDSWLIQLRAANSTMLHLQECIYDKQGYSIYDPVLKEKMPDDDIGRADKRVISQEQAERERDCDLNGISKWRTEDINTQIREITERQPTDLLTPNAIAEGWPDIAGNLKHKGYDLSNITAIGRTTGKWPNDKLESFIKFMTENKLSSRALIMERIRMDTEPYTGDGTENLSPNSPGGRQPGAPRTNYGGHEFVMTPNDEDPSQWDYIDLSTGEIHLYPAMPPEWPNLEDFE